MLVPTNPVGTNRIRPGAYVRVRWDKTTIVRWWVCSSDGIMRDRPVGAVVLGVFLRITGTNAIRPYHPVVGDAVMMAAILIIGWVRSRLFR
jgi:hypothetical protein